MVNSVRQYACQHKCQKEASLDKNRLDQESKWLLLVFIMTNHWEMRCILCWLDKWFHGMVGMGIDVQLLDIHVDEL